MHLILFGVRKGKTVILSSRKTVAAITVFLSLTLVGSNFFVPNFRSYDDTLLPVPLPNPLIVLAAYAFAIWGPIFIWLIVGLVWAFVKRPDDAEWHATQLPLIISLTVGTLWLPVAVVSPLRSTVMICIMLAAALVALYRSPDHASGFGAWPIGLYAGWLSAASCVSMSVLLTGYGVLTETLSTILFLGLAIAIGFAVQWMLKRAPTYGLAVVWALVAVAVGTLGRAEMVAYLALSGAMLISWPTLRAFHSHRGGTA